MLALISIMCIGVAVAGCIFTLGAALVVRDFGRQPSAPEAAALPGVTVLKPLHGAESGLYENLRSFASQDYGGPVQLIFGVADAMDPATVVVRQLIEAFPQSSIELVVSGPPQIANAKIANLAGMSARIRHQIVVVSDSDIRVEPDYLRRTISELSQPGVGLVTCLYRGVADPSVWARLSAMAIDYQFLPSVLLGLKLGRARPCLGATMAFSRQTLEAIGGFGAFSNHLADDHAIGEAVRLTGQEVVITPFVVVHRCLESSAVELMQHELRWAKTVRSVDPLGYLGSVITYPLGFGIAAAALRGFDALGCGTLLASLICRLVLQWQVDRMLGIATVRWMMGPVRDMLALLVFCLSFLTGSVVWRGRRYRLRADGTMEELKESTS